MCFIWYLIWVKFQFLFKNIISYTLLYRYHKLNPKAIFWRQINLPWTSNNFHNDNYRKVQKKHWGRGPLFFFFFFCFLPSTFFFRFLNRYPLPLLRHTKDYIESWIILILNRWLFWWTVSFQIPRAKYCYVVFLNSFIYFNSIFSVKNRYRVNWKQKCNSIH